MTILPSSSTLNSLYYEDLIYYLQNIGWQRFDTNNQRWIVFQGGSDTDGLPLEIIIPKNPLASDINSHFAKAINTLSALYEKNAEELITDIHYYDRDVLRVRNPKTGGLDSISINAAARQVSELKKLVAYAACSEESPKPYFISSQKSIATGIVNRYQFGHTFKGSFGFTIETPTISRDSFYIQQSYLDNVDDEYIAPTTRKVMERIVRGLQFTREATENRDSSILIDNYKQGFNANMCTAIVKMSLGKQLPLDYSVTWSSIIPPKDTTLIDPGFIELTTASYRHLEYTATVLSELEPEDITIQGLVTRLSADDNPLGLDTSRSIVIKWFNVEEGQTYSVYLVPSRDDYMKAIHAHENYLSVRISGQLKRIKNYWRMIDYHEFEVLNLSINNG